MLYIPSSHAFSGSLSFIGKTAPFTQAHYELISAGVRYAIDDLGLDVTDYLHVIGSAQKENFKVNHVTETLKIDLSQRVDMVTSNILAIGREFELICAMRKLDDLESNQKWVESVTDFITPGTVLITSNLEGVKVYFDQYAEGYLGFIYCGEDDFGTQNQDLLQEYGINSVHATEVRTWLIEGKTELAKQFLTKETIAVLGI